MSRSLKIVVCVALATGAVLFLLWLLRGDPPAPDEGMEAVASAAPPLPAADVVTPAPELSAPALREAAPAPAAEPAAAPDESRGSFTGNLCDLLGAPLLDLRQAGVVLTDAEGATRRCFDDRLRATGCFEFRDLPLGRYRVRASAHGYLPLEGEIVLEAPSREVERELRLARACVLHVALRTPDGRPFLEALKQLAPRSESSQLVPVATNERPGEWIPTLTGNANNPVGIGQFWKYGAGPEKSPGPEYVGYLVLDQDPPAFVSLALYQRVLAVHDLLVCEREIAFTLAPEDVLASKASLKVRFLDAETGQPVPDVGVTLHGPATVIVGRKSDAQGVFTAENVNPGNYMLMASARGYARSFNQLLLAPGPTEAKDIPLERGVSARARAEHEGVPVGGVRFKVGRLDAASDAVQWIESFRLTAGDDGIVDLSSLAPGGWVLLGEHDGRNPASELPPGARVSGAALIALRHPPAADPIPIRLSTPVQLMLDVADGLDPSWQVRVVGAHAVEFARIPGGRAGPTSIALREGGYRVVVEDGSSRELQRHEVVLERPVTRLRIGPGG